VEVFGRMGEKEKEINAENISCDLAFLIVVVCDSYATATKVLRVEKKGKSVA
jgi:hypothetical protein